MRIWVARPEPGAGRTAERLAAMGHAPLVAPVLVIRPTGAPLPGGPFDALVLTSANALAALLATTEAAPLRGLPVFAVGARTATLAARAGLGPVVQGRGDASALADLIRSRLAPGARLLHVGGAERKAEPAASLTAAGCAVTALVAYAAASVPSLPEPAAAALARSPPDLDAALHYSHRSAAAAHDLARAAGHGGAFRRLRHYCLSADVAVPLEAAGILVHFIAAHPSEDALLAGFA